MAQSQRVGRYFGAAGQGRSDAPRCTGEEDTSGGPSEPFPAPASEPFLHNPVSIPVDNPTDPDPDWVATFPHPKRTQARKAPAKPPIRVRQRWTTPHHVAAYFGVSYVTVCRWLRRKNLGAFVTYTRHYTDDRPRKSPRGRWRIFERDLETLLTLMRVKIKHAGFGPGFWVGGK